MTARLLDGKAIAAAIREEVRNDARRAGVTPGLTVVLVGNDPASEVYVRGKEKAAREAGFRGEVVRLPAETTEESLLRTIGNLNADPATHGFFVQLPLPSHISADKVVRAIDPRKDVDGFHPENQGLLLLGQPRFIPATPRGVVELLARSGVTSAGRHAVVVGRSTIVGKPLAAALLLKGPQGDATVTVAHSRTRDLPSLTRQADILVPALGQPRFVTRDMVKPGAVVVDVGINRQDGKVVGDVDFDGVAKVAGALTPVPGGVGPMTIAMLLRNTLDAATGTLPS